MPTAKKLLMRTFQGVVTDHFNFQGSDDFLAETDAESTRYIQPSAMSQSQYWNDLEAKLLTYGEVSDEYILKEIFINGFHELAQQSMQSNWNTHPGSTLSDLARHATSPRALQKRSSPFITKGCDRRQDSKHRFGRQLESPKKVNQDERKCPNNLVKPDDERFSGDANRI